MAAIAWPAVSSKERETRLSLPVTKFLMGEDRKEADCSSVLDSLARFVENWGGRARRRGFVG
jgi:hypothetical protein